MRDKTPREAIGPRPKLKKVKVDAPILPLVDRLPDLRLRTGITIYQLREGDLPLAARTGDGASPVPVLRRAGGIWRNLLRRSPRSRPHRAVQAKPKGDHMRKAEMRDLETHLAKKIASAVGDVMQLVDEPQGTR